MDNNTNFWLNDVCVLFKHKNLLQVFPYDNLSNNEKLNSMTRFIIYISLFGFMLMNNYMILLVGIVLILGILYLYTLQDKKENMKLKESMQGMLNSKNESPNIMENIKNPFSNVLLTFSIIVRNIFGGKCAFINAASSCFTNNSLFNANCWTV